MSHTLFLKTHLISACQDMHHLPFSARCLRAVLSGLLQQLLLTVDIDVDIGFGFKVYFRFGLGTGILYRVPDPRPVIELLKVDGGSSDAVSAIHHPHHLQVEVWPRKSGEEKLCCAILPFRLVALYGEGMMAI
jgi:hypothetical protein